MINIQRVGFFIANFALPINSFPQIGFIRFYFYMNGICPEKSFKVDLFQYEGKKRISFK